MNWNAKYVQVSPYEKMAQEKKGKEILSTHASGPEKSSMPSLIQRMLHNLGIGRSQQNPLRQCTSGMLTIVLSVDLFIDNMLCILYLPVLTFLKVQYDCQDYLFLYHIWPARWV